MMLKNNPPLKMRALGRHSLSSVLKLLVNLSWVGACATLGFIWLITLISLIALFAGNDAQTGVIGHISIQNARHLAGWTIIGTIVCLGVMAISALLRNVFDTLVAGDPFVPENAQRFQRIAFVLSCLELARMLVGPLLTFAMKSQSTASDAPVGMTFHINLIVWGAIIVLVVLSQVFEEGARLREDQRMTI